MTYSLRGTSAEILPQFCHDRALCSFADAARCTSARWWLRLRVISMPARNGGKWLVRIEDLDTPRVVPGSAADILRTLERFGFEWDGPVLYQSTRIEAYREALDRLRRDGFVYPVFVPANNESRWRVRYCEEDFTVLRSDGIFAYHLAVVVDDAYQGITDVVRGADLLDSTPRQIHLQKLLGLPSPRYRHVPVVTNEKGEE